MRKYSEALQLVQIEHTGHRQDWPNGKLIFLEKGSFDFSRFGSAEIDDSVSINGVSVKHFEKGDTGTETKMPMLCLQLPDGTVQQGWAPSQEDQLAEDWYCQ